MAIGLYYEGQQESIVVANLMKERQNYLDWKLQFSKQQFSIGVQNQGNWKYISSRNYLLEFVIVVLGMWLLVQVKYKLLV